MKRIFILSLVFLLAGPTLLAQQIVNMSLDDFYREFKKYQYNENVGEVSEVEGSPYDRVEFTPGEIVTTSRQHYSGIPLRQNIYANEIEFRNQEGKPFFIGVPELIDYILIGGEKFIYSPFRIANRIEKGYFTLLANGKAQLLEKKNVTLRPAEPAGAYKEPVPPQFRRTDSDYYIRVLPAEAKRVRNKKEMEEILGSTPDKVDDFIKKNKIKFSKKEDLIILMEYYNSHF